MNWETLVAAIVFYTRIPIPFAQLLPFHKVARWAPIVGLLIGILLAGLDTFLAQLAMPILTRSAVVVAFWIALTGGLHLDGAIDSADGLAVTDPERRLAVMTESTTGAFGAMVAGLLLLLKVTALSDLPFQRLWLLPLAAGWGRWGQQVAIGCYPYLKPTGKGAFHQQAIRSFWDTLPSLLLLLGLSALPLAISPHAWSMAIGSASGGFLAFTVAAWFNGQLGGHTGDTYGAVVEWTEALFLVGMTLVIPSPV
ncbi:MAG: adenosylcobinamide-GDP ribazoletransferase [Elainella sp. Prado103]|jgi:adenosylcobinamide-GDP ribazoletransferase|nr:adenosylcobinamide-GDP ribazoletransferase [Elainella sp. Prado103]